MIENLAARQRAEAIAAIQRRAKRQGDAAFWDGQGATDSGGNSIPVTTGSNGPLRLGQPTPLIQGGGRSQIDTFSAMRSDEPLIPLPPKGNIKVCLEVRLDNGEIQYWVGGDRPRPTLIYTVLSGSETVLEAEFEATGPAKNDWIFALKTESNGVPRLRTFSGGSATMDSGANPLVSALSYKGSGFWATESIIPRFSANFNADRTGVPSLYGDYSAALPAASFIGVRIFYGSNGAITADNNNIFPRIVTSDDPYSSIYPLSVQTQGSGSYGRIETTGGLAPLSSFLANLNGNSAFDFISGSLLNEFFGNFSEQFTTNSVAASFFANLQQDDTGTDHYQYLTNHGGAVSSRFSVERSHPSQGRSSGTDAAFTVESDPPPNRPDTPLVNDVTVTGPLTFSNTTQQIIQTSRVGTYPIYLSPTLKLSNSIEFESTFNAYIVNENSPITPTHTTTADIRKTYKSLKTYDSTRSVFYFFEEAQGYAAEITGFNDFLLPTSLPDQITRSFYLKIESAAPLRLAAPPAEPYNDHTWVKSDSALQLYKVDPQPFNTDSGGNPAIAILQADIKAEVALQNLVADTFVPAAELIEAKALRMSVPGATNQNTSILRAHYWPKL